MRVHHLETLLATPIMENTMGLPFEYVQQAEVESITEQPPTLNYILHSSKTD